MTENQIAAQLLAKPIWQITGEEFGSPAKLCVYQSHLFPQLSGGERASRPVSENGKPAAVRPVALTPHSVRQTHARPRLRLSASGDAAFSFRSPPGHSARHHRASQLISWKAGEVCRIIIDKWSVSPK